MMDWRCLNGFIKNTLKKEGRINGLPFALRLQPFCSTTKGLTNGSNGCRMAMGRLFLYFQPSMVNR